MGRGRGFRQGSGRGWRHLFWATGLPGWLRFRFGGDPSLPDEKEALRGQAQYLESRLQQIKERLGRLEMKSE